MPLSSNSLIHLTNSLEALEGILSENFRIKYCKESSNWKNSKTTIYVPMVSFCDIPLSQIKDHISNYGCYGIGLTKEWAIRNHLNPVLYMQQNSSLADSYDQALSSLSNKPAKDDATRRFYHQLSDIVRYTKNYEGTLIRKNAPPRNYRFSDEREWRYIPSIDEKCEPYYMDSDFDDPKTKEIAAKSVASMRLKFEPNDIKYLIIKDEIEITGLINHLRTWIGPNFSMQEVERLSTRIMTSEQIRTDI